MLLVVTEVYRQQRFLAENNQQSIADRIISLSQPHLRPIIRGKAGKSGEFGAKLSTSYFEGYVFLTRISWDNFNKSGDFKSQMEAYYNFTGYYPESVQKRRFSLSRVMAKLSNTSQTAIAITFLVMNLSTWLGRVFCVNFPKQLLFFVH